MPTRTSEKSNAISSPKALALQKFFTFSALPNFRDPPPPPDPHDPRPAPAPEREPTHYPTPVDPPTPPSPKDPPVTAEPSDPMDGRC